MRTASYRVSDLQRFVIPLGFVGENEHCQIVFLAEDVYQEYPHAAASLTVRPPYGEPYPAVVTRDGNNVLWTVKDSDLTRSGQGEIQLSFTTGEIVAKTYVGKTKICRSIQPTGDVPDPLEDFLTEAGAALTAIPETIDAAFDAITAEAETLEAGESATASFDSDTKVLTIGVPAGADGDPGQPGADGYSPTITVTDITGGHRLTITDKTGTRTVDVMDGEDGQPGQDGDPGAPGFSPVITVTDITGGHRLTITTATGTQTVDVMDGAGGDPTEIIDDTAGSGDTDKVWSADKTSELKIAINGKYTKPQTGIPASDLAQGLTSALLTYFYHVTGTFDDEHGQEYISGVISALGGSTTPTGINLSANTISFVSLGSQTLTATLVPSYAIGTVTWSSSNTSVATVNDGTVTAVANGSATITATCGNVTATCSVTVAIPVTVYTIAQTLTGCTSTNDATTIEEGNSYSNSLSANSGYEWNSVVITMGGNDVTSTVYDSATGSINITSVTGNIVIVATASEVSKVLYQLPQETVFNGTSYVDTNLVVCGTGNLYSKDFTITYSVTVNSTTTTPKPPASSR